VEKVLVSQPDRSSLGYSDVIMRDIASAVVREIVGIMESLTDRLLLEKKHGVIREMVAELMTDDIAHAVAAGREHLREGEFGCIHRDLAQLREQASEHEAALRKHRHESQHLRECHAQLQALVDEHREAAETAQPGFVMRGELDERLSTANEGLERMAARLRRLEGQQADLGSQLTDLKVSCQEQYAVKGELFRAESRLSEAVLGCQERAEQGARELRELRAAALDRSREAARPGSTRGERLGGLDSTVWPTRERTAEAQSFHEGPCWTGADYTARELPRGDAEADGGMHQQVPA